MCVLFVVGVMNLVWVAALTVFVLVERSDPRGARRPAAGVAMIAAGVLVLSRSLYISPPSRLCHIQQSPDGRTDGGCLGG